MQAFQLCKYLRSGLCPRGQKTPFFRAFFRNHDRFTETGSGQNIVTRESTHSKQRCGFSFLGMDCPFAHGAKNAIFAPFTYKTSILPRQARDKHRENSKKRDGVFLTARRWDDVCRPCSVWACGRLPRRDGWGVQRKPDHGLTCRAAHADAVMERAADRHLPFGTAVMGGGAVRKAES
jgi:hypothetical protein